MGTPTCTFPTPTGNGFLRLIISPYSWLNHPLYQIVTYPGSGTPTVNFTQNEIDYVAQMHANFFAVQQYLTSLAAGSDDPNGNYCIVAAEVVAGMQLYNPIDSTGLGNCGAYVKAYISPSVWAWVQAGFNDMDCANDYIRKNFNL